jgi:hypothetical protein
MRRIRQVLQLHSGAHTSARVIAREVGVGRTTVQDPDMGSDSGSRLAAVVRADG